MDLVRDDGYDVRGEWFQVHDGVKLAEMLKISGILGISIYPEEVKISPPSPARRRDLGS